MHFIINCSTLKVGGGVQVAVSFINYLHFFPNHTFLVIVSKTLSEEVIIEGKSNIKFIIYDEKPSVIKSLTGYNKKLSKIESDFNPNAVFTLFGASYWRPKNKHLVGFARPDFVYYDSPFFKIIDLKYKILNKLLYFFQINDFKNNSDYIVTENEDVTNRLKRIFKTKNITTVTNYYNQVFEHETMWDKSIVLDSDKNSFKLLTISANYPHKNLKIIQKIIPILISKYPNFKFKFYLTLEKDAFEIDFLNKYSNNIKFLGKVTVHQCPFLYQQVDAMFLPTLLECFSASYAEAMYMKKPILTSNLNFATGICEDAAMYFNPLEPEDIANKIFEIYQNKQLYNDLIVKGKKRIASFDSFSERAIKYIKILENIS